MRKCLPVVVIAGTEFYVDSQKEELREVCCPNNSIPFNVFKPVDKGFYFIYNLRTHRWSGSPIYILKRLKEYRTVLLPALMELDPEGVALHYNIPLELLCPDGASSFPVRIIAKLFSAGYRGKNHFSQHKLQPCML